MAKSKKTAKAEKPPKATGRPVCVAMLLCEKVIVGQDQSASVISIVDTITFPRGENHTPGDMIEFATASLFLALKCGDAKGTFNLIVQCVDPAGRKTPIASVPYEASGEGQSGANAIGPVAVCWGGVGVYWFELVADDVVISKTPFKIKEIEPRPKDQPSGSNPSK